MSSILDFLRGAGAGALRLLGGWDNTLRLLVAMMAMDYVSGLIVAALFYIVNEAISIVENAALAGLPLPQKLLEVLGRQQETKEG